MRGLALSRAGFAAGLAAGLLLFWSFGFVGVWTAGFLGGNDFSGIWAGPRLLVTGGDPYDPNTFVRASDALGALHPATVVYIYPGWVAVLLAPFGALDLVSANIAWTAVSVAVASIGLLVLLESYGGRQPLVYALLGFTLIGSEPGITAFYSGQTSLVVTGGLALMAAWLVRGRLSSAGVAAAAMLVKPQHFALALPALSAVALLRGERRFVYALAGAGLTLAVLSVLLLPHWPLAWLEHVATTRASDVRAANLPTALFDLFGPAGRIAGYAALVASVGAALAFGRSSAAIAVWVAVSMSVSPYLWVYDHITMIVPLAVAAGMNGERSSRAAMAISVAGMLIMVVAAALLHSFRVDRGESLSLNGLAQFALTMLVIGSLWRFRGEGSSLVPVRA